MTDQTMILAGGLAALAGALLLYLASPNQQAARRPLPRPALGWSGLAAFVLGLASLFSSAGPATAVFIAFTAAMLGWTLVPLFFAWWHRPRGNAE